MRKEQIVASVWLIATAVCLGILTHSIVAAILCVGVFNCVAILVGGIK